MSCSQKIKRLQTVELLARIVGWANTPIVPGDVTDISWSAFILEEATGDENATASVDEPLSPVSDYIFSSLQLDTKWEEDTLGYNFAFVVPGDVFEERGETYLIRATFNLTSGEPLTAVFLLEVE